MGMVVVALLAADADAVPETTIRSTFRRTNSAASLHAGAGVGEEKAANVLYKNAIEFYRPKKIG